MPPDFVGSNAWKVYRKAHKEPILAEEYEPYLGSIRMNTDDFRRINLRKANQSFVYNGKQIAILYTDRTPAYKVLDLLFEQHPEILENTTVSAVTQFLNDFDSRLGRYWSENHEEFNHTLSQSGNGGGNGRYEKQSCPLCDESIGDLPSHLPECPEA